MTHVDNSCSLLSVSLLKLALKLLKGTRGLSQGIASRGDGGESGIFFFGQFKKEGSWRRE